MIKYITRNRSYQPLIPRGIVLHETATPGATAENEYRYFNGGDRGASAHVFVDWDGYIQTIPYNEVAWHAGYTANNRYIGIEMCRPASHNPQLFEKVWNNTVDIFVELLNEFNLSVNDITTHNEVSLKWGETDHTDPVGYFNEYGKTVDDFKNDVKNKMNGGLTVTQYEELKRTIATQRQKIETLEKKTNPMIYNYIDNNMPEWARPTIQKLVDKKILKGNEDGLNLTDDLLRIFVINDRAGLYD